MQKDAVDSERLLSWYSSIVILRKFPTLLKKTGYLRRLHEVVVGQCCVHTTSRCSNVKLLRTVFRSFFDAQNTPSESSLSHVPSCCFLRSTERSLHAGSMALG